MAITVILTDATPDTLNKGVNNVTINYKGIVDKAADNDVTISAISNGADVEVISVVPESEEFSLELEPLPALTLELNVINSRGGESQVTISITFETAQGDTVTMDVVFLY